jgi:hypothetical protein
LTKRAVGAIIDSRKVWVKKPAQSTENQPQRKKKQNMKTYIQMLVAVFTAMFLASCATNTQTAVINGGGGGGRSVHRSVARTQQTVSDLSIFGNQPAQPTQAALGNQSTWGAVNGNVSGWNELRPSPRARVQNIPSNLPILVDRETGWQWKAVCHNRIRPFVAQATEEVVEEAQSGGGNSIVQNGPTYQLALNINVERSDGVGVFMPQRQFRPQQRYCVPVRRYCPPPQQRYCPPRPICPPGTYPVRRY